MAALLAGTVEIAALPLTNVAPIKGVSAAAVCPVAFGVHINLAFCLRKSANAATRDFANWLLHTDRDDSLERLGLFR